MSETLGFIVKNSQGSIWAVTVPESGIISDLKDEIRKRAKIKEDKDIRIVWQGMLLEESRSIRSYNFIDGTIIYISVCDRQKKPVATRAPTSTAGGMFEILNSPIGKQMMKTVAKNPEIYKKMLTSNPEVQKVMESNPELLHMLNDSDMLEEQIAMMASADGHNQMAKTLDNMMDAVEAMPGGFNALNRHMNTIQNPIMDGVMGSIMPKRAGTTQISAKAERPSDQPLPALSNASESPFAMLFGGAPAPPRPVQTSNNHITELENRVRRMLSSLKQMGLNVADLPGMEPLKQFDSGDVVQEPDYEKMYAVQLRQMNEMGLIDKEANISALVACNGNVGMAIQWLFKK